MVIPGSINIGNFLLVFLLIIIEIMPLIGKDLHSEREQTSCLFVVGNGAPLLEEFLQIIVAILVLLDKTILIPFCLLFYVSSKACTG